MFIQKENFIIKLESQDESYINSIDFRNIYDNVTKFYNFSEKIPIKIYLLYSVEEHMFFSNKFFDNWYSGFAVRFHDNNLIFMFAPSVIEKFTTHKKESFHNTITHELAHLIYSKMNFKNINLIEEGIATYIANYENHKHRLVSVDLKDHDTFTKDHLVYHKGFCLINNIIQKFGKEKLFMFLKTLKPYTTDEELIQQFETYFKTTEF